MDSKEATLWPSIAAFWAVRRRSRQADPVTGDNPPGHCHGAARTLAQLTSRPHSEWKDNLRDLAAIVNRADAADTALLGFEERAREPRAAISAPVLNEEISLVELYPDGRVGFRLRNSFPGLVLAKVGLRRPPNQDRDAGPDECTCADFSQERLAEADGDRFFVLGNPDTVDTLAQVQANPLWARLRAVQAGKVHIADLGRWLFGGIAQAHLILGDLRTVLIDGGEPATGEISYTLPS